MDALTTPDTYGVMIEPATLKIQRSLPGPVDNIWSHLTESNLRRRWLASGEMKLEVGAPFEFVWRNDELTDPPGKRPSGFSDEQRMESRITKLDPPRMLAFTWGDSAEVTCDLEPQGDQVLLTVIHRGFPDRDTTTTICAGWHMHLDLLVAQITGAKAEPFWDGWSRLKKEYERRIPA